MKLRSESALRLAALLLAGSTATPASAQMFLNPPDFKPGPIDGGDALVGLPVPGATPAEQRAHLIWNLRAGLNVAALQCQFSPYLRTVGNYNGLLAHHSGEFETAYKALNGYFKRVHGKEGQKKFDDYSTITYNNFSTLHAQYGFCNTAADIAKEALTRPKGDFYVTARSRMRELRNSLVPAVETVGNYNPYNIAMPILPPLDEKCYDRKNRLRDRCATAARAVAAR